MAANTSSTIVMGSLFTAMQDFGKLLLQRVSTFFLLAGIALVLSLGYYFFQKPAYEARVSFVLEEKSSSLSSGLSGIASSFGIDIASMSGGSTLFSGDNILDILQSRRILTTVLLSRVDSTKDASGNTLADLYKSMNQVVLPSSFDYLTFSELQPGKSHAAVYDSVLGLMTDRLIKKQIVAERQNKKGSIIAFRVTTPNQQFSKLFAERVVAQTQQLYVTIKTGYMATNVAKLEAKADSILRLANDRSFQSAHLQVLNANAAFSQATVPAELSQRDRLLSNTLYAEVVKNLEAARLTLAGQTPVMQLLDSPVYPLADKKKSLFKLLLLSVGVALVLFIVLTFIETPPTRVQ
ncbi:MAG: hypothetical protein FJY16_00070 [Bacteroidetes bacterium]|nr:hypothetical protein [Bacteroidota bacterium]